jgi:hypothetical protein
MKHPWTVIHSHFAIMGGFAFDNGTGVESFLPGKRTRVTLSNRGVYALAQKAPEFLPNSSRIFQSSKFRTKVRPTISQRL